MTVVKERLALPEFQGSGRLVFGRDATARLPAIVAGTGARHLRIVLDRHVRHDTLAAALAALRRDRTVTIDEHDGSEPSLGAVTALAASGGDCDLVVAIGGGSTIDTGKAIALARRAGGPIERFEGADRVDVEPLPLIALPTTAGTGSEVSGSCVLTAPGGDRKLSIRSAKLRPVVAVLDPRFLASVPKGVIRAAGVDALAHAIEAYFSTAGSLLTDTLALRAMRLIARALPRYYADPADAQAADDMCWGAAIAGIAFTSARVGLAHAIASAIGPLTGLSHGLSVGLALPAALATNFQARAADGAELMAALDAAPDGGHSPERALLERLAAIYRAVEFPATARALGAPFTVDDGLVARIIDSGRLETNPVALDAASLRDVLRAIGG